MDEEILEVYDLPTILTVADCEREFPDVYIISKYNTYEKFDEFYYKIYYAICACVEIPECVSYKIKFKFYQEAVSQDFPCLIT